MIASPFYYQKPSVGKLAPKLLKHVSQRSLAVLLFIALALLASVGNKQTRHQGLSSSVSLSSDHEPYLSLNLGQLFEHAVKSFKDAFNDPALIEYAKEQGVDIPDSPTMTDANKQTVCSPPN